MKIHGLCVSVNYSDFFRLSIARWLEGLETLTIVTDSKDRETAKLALEAEARLFITDIFYEHGAKFNKGAAMEQARQHMPWEDWVLFFDADVRPEPDWLKKLETIVTLGKLYGATRYQHDGRWDQFTDLDSPRRFSRIPDAPCDGGYFQLFHTQDPAVQGRSPLLETDWSHAGVYDSHFKKLWPRQHWIVSPVDLIHLGERENWTGRGDKEGMRALLHARNVKGGYQHERIQK